VEEEEEPKPKKAPEITKKPMAKALPAKGLLQKKPVAPPKKAPKP